jgi:hypothetical protein
MRFLTMPRLLVLTAMLTAAAGHASAQGNLQVSVKPQVISQTGDSIKLAYTVRVLPASGADSLTQFSVLVARDARVDAPTPKANWLVANTYKQRPVASWVYLVRMWGVQDAIPPLTVTARGLLGVVQYWAARREPPDTVVTSLASDTLTMQDTVVDIVGLRGTTVGIVDLPADRSPGALATRLSALIDQLCALGWIDNNGICNSLRVKATAAAGPLNALRNELSAQRGKHVSEEAYTILSQNVAYLVARLP